MLSILLINDNKIVSRLLQLSSKKSGFDIEESGVFAPQKESYNLIFVDSDKYSDELIQKIKENLTYDKLVFIGTAQVKKPDSFELVLEKPFLPTDFTSLVEKNFIVEEKKEDISDEDVEIIDFDDIEEDVEDLDNLLDDTTTDKKDDKLNTSPENLAQMVDEIDEIDNNDEEEINIEEQEEFNIDDDLILDEDDIETKEESLLDLDTKTEDKKKELIIEDEKDNTTTEDDFLSLDKYKVKEVLEPKKDDDTIKNDEVELETEDKTTNISKIIEKDIENEIENTPENLEKLIENKIKEILTPKLIQDALKGTNLYISFEDKD